MPIALRRFGGGMAAMVAWAFLVASVLMLWDAATRLWFFDALSRLDINAVVHPGFGSSAVRTVVGLFYPSAIWPIWAATLAASVAVLNSPKLGGYRLPALVGIGFGPALTTMLEGSSPVSGRPMILLVPLWLLVIVVDVSLTLGLAWCILTAPKRGSRSIRTAREECNGTEPLVIALGALVVFAGTKEVGWQYCGEVLADRYKRQAAFNRAQARTNVLRETLSVLPEMLYVSIVTELLPRLLPKRWCGFVLGHR